MFPRHKTIWVLIISIMKREVRMYLRRPLLLFCLLLAPMICIIFFTTLMEAGLPTNLPAGVLDEDDTQVSRTFLRTLDAMEQTEIVAHFHTFA